jgi:hypothetical protein
MMEKLEDTLGAVYLRTVFYIEISMLSKRENPIYNVVTCIESTIEHTEVAL